MSQPDELCDKNPRDINVSQITQLFHQFGFDKGTDVDKYLENAILKKKLNGKALLDGSKGDLIDILGLKEEDDINKFIKLRVALYKQEFLKREVIDLDKINAKTLTWEQVCQLLGEKVGVRDERQRMKWYSYIEDETIDGEVLLKSDITDIIKELDLNKGQKTKFENLLVNMQGGNAQPKGGTNSVSNHNCTMGSQLNAGNNATITYGNISVGNHRN